MIIEHRQYLTLLDQIDFLKKDNQLLKSENIILTQELANYKQKNIHLQNLHHNHLTLIEQLHSKNINNQNKNAKEIMESLNSCNTSTKLFLEDKFKLLQQTAYANANQAQLKYVKNKLDLYELNDFVNKIRTIYRESKNSETLNNKKLTLSELIKWIKSISFTILSQQKMGLTGSISTNCIKNKGKNHILKQNKRLKNSTIESKSKTNPFQKQSIKPQI